MADETTIALGPDHFFKALKIATHQQNVIQIQRCTIYVLEMEDVLFHLNSAVMMPENPEGRQFGEAPSPSQRRVSGVRALALVFRHLQSHPGRRLLVCGHTDTSGGFEFNFDLSDLRAQNILFLLQGRRTEWVDISKDRHNVEDYQQIMTYCYEVHGWSSNPEGIDNQWGSRTRTATENFINDYNAWPHRNPGTVLSPDLIAEIESDPEKDWPAPLWEAVYDIYQHDMVLAVTGEHTATPDFLALRAGLSFVHPGTPFVGCGESFPISKNRSDNYRSQNNRRVEILIFDTCDEIAIECPSDRDRAHTEAECPLRQEELWNYEHIDPEDYYTAEIHADFDRTVTLDQSANERAGRLVRPGAILLPNLNRNAGILPNSPSADLTGERDSDNTTIQGQEDADEMTEMLIRSPEMILVKAEQLLLHTRPEDVERIRIFERRSGTPNTWPAVMGSYIGNDGEVPFDPDAEWSQQYLIEGCTLPGDPLLPAPTGPAPNDPTTSRSSGTPLFPETAPGEVWLELLHRKNNRILDRNYDVALFTLASFILQDNTQECERLYAVCKRVRNAANATYYPAENHDFIYDLMEACWEAFGLGASTDFDRDTSTEFAANTPLQLNEPDDTTPGQNRLSPGRMYLIDANLYGQDVWIQDEMEMGYCCAPGDRGYNLAVHLKRNRGLSGFVTYELVDHDVALFNNLDGPDNDGQDNGGNVESTPAVDVATDPQPGGNAGPAMPAHPVAAFGKIVLGDCHNRHRRYGNGRVHDETRTFLQSQVVQPIIPVNTSWLAVGHCDEVMSFIPSVTSRGSRLLMADCDCMEELLREIRAIPFDQGRTHFHRGKFAGEYPNDYWRMVREGTQTGSVSGTLWATYAEISAENLATGDIAQYSERIQTEFLEPIRDRLMHCSNHTNDDVTSIPMYFKPGRRPTLPFGHSSNQTVSETVGMVNLQIVNNHLLIPKPFGPRMRAADAQTVVQNALGGGAAVVLPPDQTEFTFWAWPGLPFEKVGLFFTHPDTPTEREEIIHRIKGEPDAIDPALEAVITQRREEIALANGLSPGMGVFTQWQRLLIPDNSVDVIETYMLTVLADTGCTSHFIDDWFYHVGMGEVHCGTNVKRTVPTGSSPHWWDVYDPTVDTSYDPRAA